MSTQHVAVLGLGLMGSGMASRLLGAGFDVTVYNRTRERAAPLASKGAHVANSPREAARNADVIIAMVADDVASRAVWLGEDGALADVKRGAICVESSTVSVPWVRELAGAVTKGGCQLLDAPVTGSKGAAAVGELNFLVGGDAGALARVQSLLDVMGRQAIHVGPTGSGAMLKLINNFLCGVQLVSLAQAVGMIDRAGLTRDQAISVLSNGAPGSPMVKALAGRMSAHNYEPNFLLKLMAKDLRYTIDEAKAASLDLTTAEAALEALQRAISQGMGEKDLSAVVELYRTKP